MPVRVQALLSAWKTHLPGELRVVDAGESLSPGGDFFCWSVWGVGSFIADSAGDFFTSPAFFAGPGAGAGVGRVFWGVFGGFWGFSGFQ